MSQRNSSINNLVNLKQPQRKGQPLGRFSVAPNKPSEKKISYDYLNHNVELLDNGKIIFKDIREDILTKKVEKALIKVQQIDNQKYALKLLGLKHFLINLSRFTNSFMNKNLQKYHKITIRDLSLPENNNSSSHAKGSNQRNRDEDDSKLNFIDHIIQLIPLFNPSNTFLVIWDIFQLVFILLFFYAIPLQIVFNLGLGRFISDQMFNTGLTLFLIDNILCINTTYFDKGVPVQDRQLIWHHYLRKHFVTDFLSNIPVLIDYFIQNLKGGWGLIMLMQYLKTDRITIIIRKVEERFHLSPQQQQLVRLAKLLFRVLFVAHIFACMWLYLALSNKDDSVVWLNKFDYNTKTWSEQYLVSYYFTTVTMITVGYGDFGPVNNREFIFCVVTMLIACGVFAYAVNQIGSIFENMSKQDKQMKEIMYSISSYMHLKKVSKELQYQIREYLQYYWTEQQDRDTEVEEKIKNQLSDNLRDQLALEANNIVLKDSVVFINNFSNQVINKTVPLIKEYRATPQEVILIENTVTEDQNIYFIEKGEVEVYLSQSDQPIQIQKLSSGDCFGQVGFFTGLSRTLSVRSLDFTTLIYIKRSEFIELLKEYPEDYEQFCFIKDKILNEGDFRLIGMKCYSCKDGKHLTNECPYLHFKPKKFLLLKKYFYPGRQNREKWKRKKTKKASNSLGQKENLKEKAEEIQEQFSMIIDDLFGDDDFYDSEGEEKGNENEKTSENEEQSTLQIPSYLWQGKKASIDKQLENSQNKIDELQMSESSSPANSNKKITIPPQYQLQQLSNQQIIQLHQNIPSNQQTPNDKEDISSFIIQDKHLQSGIQIPQQTSMNLIFENKFNEMPNYQDNIDSVVDQSIQKSGYLVLPKDGRKKTPSIQKSFPSQSTQGTREIKEYGINPQIFSSQSIIAAPPINNSGHTLNLKQDQRKSIKKVSRQESRRKSTKKQQNCNGKIGNGLTSTLKPSNSIKDDSTIYSKQLTSQTSKLEALSKQMTKYKMNNNNFQLKANDQKNNNNNILALESIKRISQDQFSTQMMMQKLIEILGMNNLGQRNSQLENSHIIIEGSDNKTNFFGLEDFDSLKNYSFYYPVSNAEYVIEKLMSIKNNSSVKHNLFMQLNKLKPNVQNNNQPSNQGDLFVRKNRKTGGTRIIAAGGVTGNLINKFRQLEESGGNNDQNNDIESHGTGSPANNLSVNIGESSPFVRGGVRKATKRQNIVGSLSLTQEQPPDHLKDQSNEEPIKQNQAKKSKFQNELPQQIEEDQSEDKRLSQNSQELEQKQYFNGFTQRLSQMDQLKSSSRNNFFEGYFTNRGGEMDDIIDFKGNTFSCIPSQQSINDNGHLPLFQNLECSAVHNKKYQTNFLS